MRLKVVYNNETLNLLLREPQGETGWSLREGKSRNQIRKGKMGTFGRRL